jgi:predicted nucleic acid-binding protein
MMYLDTSAFVKRFVSEGGSGDVAAVERLATVNPETGRTR